MSCDYQAFLSISICGQGMQGIGSMGKLVEKAAESLAVQQRECPYPGKEGYTFLHFASVLHNVYS